MALKDRTETRQARELSTPTYASGNSLVKAGAVAGLIAGAIFVVMEMIMSAAMGMGAMSPWAMFASVVLGKSAMQGMTFGTFIVGFIVHFALSALFGVVWGAIAKAVPLGIRTSYGSHGAAAAIFGIVIYLVNFHVIARLFYPWFLNANQFGQLVLHAIAFGLPLGLLLVWQIRSPALVGGKAHKHRTV